MAGNSDEPVKMSADYNENSRPQLEAVDSTLQYVREAIDVFKTQSSSSPLLIADFGCAQGRNSMHVMKFIIQCLKKTNKIKVDHEVLVVHSDLPTNGWTTLFDLLNQDNSYYGVANGRSFYEACLPDKSLSIGYSSTSLHWLSRKPCNISNHCSSLFAQGNELKAFEEQARLDWTHFLQYRSRELVGGGVLILLIPCVDDQGSNGFDIIRELLYQCAQSILTPQELLEYTLPIYARSYKECVDNALFDRLSLELIKADFGSVKMPFIDQWQTKEITTDQFIQSMTAYIRSWSDAILQQVLLMNHRSNEDIKQIQDQFWSSYEHEARKELPQLVDMRMNYIYLILKKKENIVE